MKLEVVNDGSQIQAGLSGCVAVRRGVARQRGSNEQPASARSREGGLKAAGAVEAGDARARQPCLWPLWIMSVLARQN